MVLLLTSRERQFMKRALMLTAAVAAALSLAACNKRADETVADTSAAATQSVGATQDAVGAAVGQTSAATL